MEKIKLGVVCFVRTTFDFKAAEEIFKDSIKKLKEIEEIEWVLIEKPVIEVEDAEAAGITFAKELVDGLIFISGTFHLGHLALAIKKHIDKPVLFWGYDELPYNGGKIRLNSVCGVNLNASNLYKAGFDDVFSTVGNEIDKDFIDAIRMKTALKNSKVGILGYRAHGFFNLSVADLDTYSKTGILIDHYEISDLLNQDVSDEDVASFKNTIVELFSVEDISDEQLEKVSVLTAKFKKFYDKNNLSGLAVRCWPEFADTFGISPCVPMSILQNYGYILSCEGDLEAAMSMIICKAVGNIPFLADLSQVNIKENFALMWHCGVAPSKLWDGKSKKTLDTYFAGGRGVTVDFVLKEGHVNFVRIDSARGKTRLFLQEGTAVSMEKELKGTYAKVVFDITVSDLLQRVTNTGVAHHIAMIYDNKINSFKIFSKIMGFEII